MTEHHAQYNHAWSNSTLIIPRSPQVADFHLTASPCLGDPRIVRQSVREPSAPTEEYLARMWGILLLLAAKALMILFYHVPRPRPGRHSGVCVLAGQDKKSKVREVPTRIEAEMKSSVTTTAQMGLTLANFAEYLGT